MLRGDIPFLLVEEIEIEDNPKLVRVREQWDQQISYFSDGRHVGGDGVAETQSCLILWVGE